MRINPNYFGIYDNLENIFREIGHLDKSISFLKKGLEVSPDNPSQHANLGMTYLQKGELKKVGLYLNGDLKSKVNMARTSVRNGKEKI